MTEEVLNPVIDAAAAELAEMNAAFESVNTGEPPIPEKAEEAPPIVEDEPEAPEVAVVEAEPEPSPAEIRAAFAKIAKLEAEQAKTHANVNGKFGEFNQALRDLRVAPVGKKLAVEQFPKMKEQFGEEYVQAFVDDHNAIASAPSPEPAAPVAPAFDPEKFKQEVKAETDAKLAMTVAEFALSSVDKDWKKLTGTAEFRAWRDSHPADVANEISYGRDPEFLSQMLTGFKGHLKAEAERLKPQAKDKQRLAAAITPTGAPPAGRSPQSDRSDLEKGFASAAIN